MNGKEVEADVAKSQLPQQRIAWLILSTKTSIITAKIWIWDVPNMKHESVVHIISKLRFLTYVYNWCTALHIWHCDALCLTVNYHFPTVWEGSTLTFWQWKVWASKEANQPASVAFTTSATDSTMVLGFLPVITKVSPHFFIQYFKTINTLRTGTFKLFKCTFPGSKQFKSTFLLCFFKNL